MKQKIRLFQRVTFLLIAGLLVIPVGLQAQQGNRKYPEEVLASRIIKLSKDYQANIIYNPGQNDVTVPELVTNDTDVTKAMKKTLASTGFTFIVMADKSIVVKKGDQDASAQQPAGIKTDKGKGSLSGTVLDEKQEPVIGVTVMIVGNTSGTATGADGSYKLPMVDAGTLSVRFSFISYETLEVNEVKINPGKTTRLDVVLKESSEELNEVVVTASFKQASAEGLYANQKTMTAMSDGVSADLIKKTSDNNIAQVLKRVSGVTIQDGKYVTVRGMSERYNNVQLNGTSLPSTEPNRRNFSFDIIPSNLVDNVTIAKTFTPDMQGEFSGGMVEVTTLAVPKEQFFNLSIGSGFNTNSTGKEFLSNTRFNSDYLLGNSSERKWFNRDWNNDQYDTYFSLNQLKPESMADAAAMNAKIPNHWGLNSYTAAPMQNYALSIGKPYDLGEGNTLGVVLAGTYRHEETIETIEEANFRSPGTSVREGQSYKFTTAIGAVANIGWQRAGHKVTLHNLFNNRFTHTNMERLIDNESSGFWLEQYSSPLRNELWQVRLDGEHALWSNKLKLTWFGDYNKLRREQPDDRLISGKVPSIEFIDPVTNVLTATPARMTDGSYPVDYRQGIQGGRAAISDGHIMYGNLIETKKNAGANLEFPFQINGNPQKIKAGYWGTFRQSHYQQQFLRPQNGPNWTNEVSVAMGTLGTSQFLSPEFMQQGIVTYGFGGVQGNKVDFYDGNQTIHAAYLMSDILIFKRLHLIGGIRMENSNTDVNTRYVTYPDGIATYPDSIVVRTAVDWLPSVSAIYNITDKLNIRAAYGKTLARPDFRELTPYHYYNVSDRANVRGYFPLKTTYTHNYDFRVEWYPQAGDVLSISVFYKEFKDPVELLTYDPSGSGTFECFAYNLDKSTLKGLELNWRKSMGFLTPSLKNLYFSGNATYLKGDVQYNIDKLNADLWGYDPGIVTSPDRSRPLAGLAPYTVNAGLDYQGKVLGASVNYGTNGRKVVIAAPQEFLDEYEAPRQTLDFQLSARLLKNRLEIKANASDILNQPYIVYVNSSKNNDDYTDDMGYNKDKDNVRSKITKGVSFSLSVGYKF